MSEPKPPDRRDPQLIGRRIVALRDCYFQDVDEVSAILVLDDGRELWIEDGYIRIVVPNDPQS